ncbi:hypothetical protein B0H19DRAFT_1201422 [Mycena capillaripes]|nr:hypothetical protein B0H19DRAFT_1201422 [Mycena capillaripes]
MYDIFSSSSYLFVSRRWAFEILCHEKLCQQETLSLYPTTKQGNKLKRRDGSPATEATIGRRQLEIYTANARLGVPTLMLLPLARRVWPFRCSYLEPTASEGRASTLQEHASELSMLTEIGRRTKSSSFLSSRRVQPWRWMPCLCFFGLADIQQTEDFPRSRKRMTRRMTRRRRWKQTENESYLSSSVVKVHSATRICPNLTAIGVLLPDIIHLSSQTWAPKLKNKK